MNVPVWRKLDLEDGVLREATPESGRVVVWLPGKVEGAYQFWERVGNVAGAAVSVADGICATAATALRARQRRRSFFGKLLRSWSSAGDGALMLPNGESAEPQGERRTDVLLAWGESEDIPLGEEMVRARWPQAQHFRRIGKTLFLVSSVQTSETAGAALPPPGCPREQAEWLLAAARKAGDRRQEASALNDLGIVCSEAGELAQAVAFLEEALALSGQLGDGGLEGDVRGNLGLAVLASGQRGRALQLLEQSLEQARAGGDRYAEKTALDRLGKALACVRAPGQALGIYGEALALARALGDRRHEAELLWHLATQHAELGERDEAVAQGQAAVDVLAAQHHPQTGWFADSLRKYCTGEAAVVPAGPDLSARASTAGEVVVGSWASTETVRPAAVTGPGLLRMAFTAAKSMARFLGSGLQAVPVEKHRKRLRACAGCAYHTGMRCRVCGCFTNAKAWMPHEQCPLGKWAE